MFDVQVWALYLPIYAFVMLLSVFAIASCILSRPDLKSDHIENYTLLAGMVLSDEVPNDWDTRTELHHNGK
jgi:hypothetical protein